MHLELNLTLVVIEKTIHNPIWVQRFGWISRLSLSHKLTNHIVKIESLAVEYKEGLTRMTGHFQDSAFRFHHNHSNQVMARRQVHFDWVYMRLKDHWYKKSYMDRSGFQNADVDIAVLVPL